MIDDDIRHFEVMGHPEYREPTLEERLKWPGVERIITKMDLTGITEVYRPSNPDAKELMLQQGLRGMQTGKDLGRQRQFQGGEAQSLTAQMEARRIEHRKHVIAIWFIVEFLRSFGKK